MRWFMALVLLGLAFVLIIFEPDLSEVFDFDPAEGDPDIARESTPTPDPAPEPTPVTAIDASADRDPRDVLQDLMQDPDNPNLELVYEYLPERFQVLEYDPEWVGMIAPVLDPTFADSPDEFEVEDYDGYTLVRSTDDWLDTWTFVIEDGEWRFDPGDRGLIMASAQMQEAGEGGFSYGMSAPADYRARSWSEPDDDSITPLVRGRMQGVGVQENEVDVVIVWEHELGSMEHDPAPVDSHLLSDVVIPIDSISWHAGDLTGDIDVVWSDGGVADGEIRLPGWPDEEMADEAAGGGETYPMEPYVTTLRLIDVPDDVEEITLEFDRIEVGPIGDDRPSLEGEVITYSWEFVFPQHTTDPVLIGEAPPAPDQEQSPEAITRNVTD